MPDVGHAHCPACWAEATLEAVMFARSPLARGLGRVPRPPAPCASCRRLVTDELLAEIVAEIEEVLGIQAQMQAHGGLAAWEAAQFEEAVV